MVTPGPVSTTAIRRQYLMSLMIFLPGDLLLRRHGRARSPESGTATQIGRLPTWISAG
jgi:hypothetical protein